MDAAGDRLRLLKSLLTQPCGYGEAAEAVVAEDEDVSVFVHLMVGAAGDLAHGDEHAAFDAGGPVLPMFADIEQQGWVLGVEEGFGLVCGDFELHDFSTLEIEFRVLCAGHK